VTGWDASGTPRPNDWHTRLDTVHVGHRVFARGQNRWQTVVIITLALGLAFGAGILQDPRILPVVLRVVVGPWAIVMLWVLLVGRGRIQITTEHVYIRKILRTRTIPREQIAKVLYVGKRTGGLRRTGYVALLAADGEPLWQSPAHIWRPETIEALLHTGQESVRIDQLSRSRGRELFPKVFKADVPALIKRILLGTVLIVVTLVVAFLIFSAILFYS